MIFNEINFAHTWKAQRVPGSILLIILIQIREYSLKICFETFMRVWKC